MILPSFYSEEEDSGLTEMDSESPLPPTDFTASYPVLPAYSTPSLPPGYGYEVEWSTSEVDELVRRGEELDGVPISSNEESFDSSSFRGMSDALERHVYTTRDGEDVGQNWQLRAEGGLNRQISLELCGEQSSSATPSLMGDNGTDSEAEEEEEEDKPRVMGVSVPAVASTSRGSPSIESLAISTALLPRYTLKKWNTLDDFLLRYTFNTITYSYECNICRYFIHPQEPIHLPSTDFPSQEDVSMVDYDPMSFEPNYQKEDDKSLSLPDHDHQIDSTSNKFFYSYPTAKMGKSTRNPCGFFKRMRVRKKKSPKIGGVHRSGSSAVAKASGEAMMEDEGVEEMGEGEDKHEGWKDLQKRTVEHIGRESCRKWREELRRRSRPS